MNHQRATICSVSNMLAVCCSCFLYLFADMEEMSMAYGPSWEPVMAQISLAMEMVSRPSLDPSPALPWWDKMRLIYHGRFTLLSQHLALFMRASLDPYNITEHMEISWSEVFIEWTNGK